MSNQAKRFQPQSAGYWRTQQRIADHEQRLPELRAAFEHGGERCEHRCEDQRCTLEDNHSEREHRFD